MTDERDEDGPERMRRLAHLSLCFVIDSACSGMAGLKTVDAVLVMAVNQANIAPLTRDPDARIRYGALDAPAPDEDRRPVSVSAVAASLKLPYETTRRYVNMMVRDGQCERQGRRGVIIREQAFDEPGILNAMWETLASFNRLASMLRRMDYAPSVTRR